ncbi:MAG: YdiU family protein [Polyangiaceae bacterium]|nr:YdiU family protein [Polyangiaceae bacterium]
MSSLPESGNVSLPRVTWEEAPPFQRRFTQELPADPSKETGTRQVLDACFSFVEPTAVAAPRLLAYSPKLAREIGLTSSAMEDPVAADVLSGSALTSEMRPWAGCYGGHQFGNWAGQLGDGRAISLGELESEAGFFELQLKGAGPTPYSRSADGRAVLRSSIREFLCSEAMHWLGVPTTRALSLVATGESVVRDMFYSGRALPEPGAVVCRVAPSFLRFGNFQLFASRGDTQTLRKLVDYTIRYHFPELAERFGTQTDQAILEFYREVARLNAAMCVEWMRVGFVHGVMNTDNMSILGLTIDYGPYGWLEGFDPNWTPNTTDFQGRRYRYGHQPQICAWNIWQLGNALALIMDQPQILEEVLRGLEPLFDRLQGKMMARKLGFLSLDLESPPGSEQVAADKQLVDQLFDALQASETDMTIFFRHLADLPIRELLAELKEPSFQEVTLDWRAKYLAEAYYDEQGISPDADRAMNAWLRKYVVRAEADLTLRAQKVEEALEQRREQMQQANPKYVLRNYLAQIVIEKAEKGDTSALLELFDVLQRPYDEQPGREAWAQKRPEWARDKPGCSMLSCSS